MTPKRGITLDTGALIAIERSDRRMTSLLVAVLAAGATAYVPAGVLTAYVPAGVLAQVWRGGPRQARLAKLLADPSVELVPLDGDDARAAGVLCGLAKTSDVIDASVVLCARAHGRTAIVTGDPSDLRKLDPAARIIAI